MADALSTNSGLTEVNLHWDRNTRRLVDAYLDRNKGNLEKKAASLFFMLLPLLSLNGDELSEKATPSFDISIAVEDHEPPSSCADALL